jgi:DNA adenine methylase
VFADWTFTCTDVEAVPLDRNDFVYADPPYDVEFTHYAKDGFKWADQERTAEWLAKHRGPVVLVNQATDRVEKLYRKLGYRVQFLEAPRRISCTGDRTPAREIMGTRNV